MVQMNSGAALSLENVRFGYEEAQVRLDVAIPAGAFVAVCGPSGSGKTTMLNLIAGFETPASGVILIGGAEMTAKPVPLRPVSFLFQEHNLFPHLTIHDNVGLGISPALRLAPSDEANIAAALSRLGMEDKAHRLPHELSGGERQRAALARVLVQDNPVLLMDEPFASLGPGLRQEMTALIVKLHAELGMTLLLVTHHPAELLNAAPLLCFIEAGEVRAFGATQQLLSPQGPAIIQDYLGQTLQIR
jgi:thiamine transport system ATP-binding protein